MSEIVISLPDVNKYRGMGQTALETYLTQDFSYLLTLHSAEDIFITLLERLDTENYQDFTILEAALTNALGMEVSNEEILELASNLKTRYAHRLPSDSVIHSLGFVNEDAHTPDSVRKSSHQRFFGTQEIPQTNS